MSIELALPESVAAARGTIADAVFDHVRRSILELRIKPGTKLSEADVARRIGVSRQPVREAFIRLSQMGYIRVQPQRRTEVVKISTRAVMNARFVREALEVASARKAALERSEAMILALKENLGAQERARAIDDREAFHRFDDEFHRLIAESADCGFIWAIIEEQKAQMDRVRYLSLAFEQPTVHDDHMAIFLAIRDRDPDAVERAMRIHLSRISHIIDRLKQEFGEFFDDGPETTRG